MNYADVAVDRFYKAILSGIRNHLTSVDNARKLADDLDIDTFMGDNIVEYVKNSLVNACSILIGEFSEAYLMRLTKSLEDV